MPLFPKARPMDGYGAITNYIYCSVKNVSRRLKHKYRKMTIFIDNRRFMMKFFVAFTYKSRIFSKFAMKTI